jgi:hypothetical protein
VLYCTHTILHDTLCSTDAVLCSWYLQFAHQEELEWRLDRRWIGPTNHNTAGPGRERAQGLRLDGDALNQSAPGHSSRFKKAFYSMSKGFGGAGRAHPESSTSRSGANHASSDLTNDGNFQHSRGSSVGSGGSLNSVDKGRKSVERMSSSLRVPLMDSR